MKLLLGITLIATQALAAPIVDTNTALVNIMNQRRADTAKAQGVTIAPITSSGSGIGTNPVGGISTTNSFFKANVSNGTLKSCGVQPTDATALALYNGCIASGGVPAGSSANAAAAALASCKTQAIVDAKLKELWVNGTRDTTTEKFDSICSAFLDRAAMEKDGTDYPYRNSSRCKKYDLLHDGKWQQCVRMVYEKTGCPTITSDYNYINAGQDKPTIMGAEKTCY